jgi:hypothetical protein
MEGKDRQKGRDLPSLDISHFLIYLSTRNLLSFISTPALDLSPTLVHRHFKSVQSLTLGVPYFTTNQHVANIYLRNVYLLFLDVIPKVAW